MVQITLTNNHPQAPTQQATINFVTGICDYSDQKLSINELRNKTDFTHPLFLEPTTIATDGVFLYEYDNLDKLLRSAIYVYSTLLQTDKPGDCAFKIRPSPHFAFLQLTENISISINSDTIAEESIGLKQLERIISKIDGYNFVFSENILLDDTFTLSALPAKVDGDLLYKVSEPALELLKTPKTLNNYELRYINSTMGFGVFNKTLIKQGDIISFYNGIKKSAVNNTLRFAFYPKHDCLNMFLDARQHGNITRFINHAPTKDKEQSTNQTLLKANVHADNHYLYGIEIIIYTAIRDIAPGEQLLVDYGHEYFTKVKEIRFKTNGRQKKTTFSLNNSQKKIYHLRAMAHHGVKKAQYYIQLRMIIIICMICMILKVVHTLN